MEKRTISKNKLTQTTDNLKIQRIVLIIAVLLFIIKITAWFYTNSLSVLSDALESIVNIIAGTLGLYSLHVAAKPRDTDHPYGYGKVEFISSAAEGAFIILGGLYIIYKAVESCFYPHEVAKIDVGIILMLLTAVINYTVGVVCIRVGKENRSLQLIASGKHLKTDTFSTAGIIIGLLLILYTGYQHIDSIVAILAAGFVIVTGIGVLRTGISGMMDEADEVLLKEIVKVLDEVRTENWIDLHNMRFIKYGSTLHCDCHLTVPWYLNVREAHEEITRLAEVIKNQFGTTVEMFVHTDPCQEYSCPICTKQHCLVRQHPFKKRITWTVENIVKDNKHRLTS